MTTTAARAHHPRELAARGQAARQTEPRSLFVLPFKKSTASVKDCRRIFDQLVNRVISSPGIVLFEAVEAGVPTYLVHLIAGATAQPFTSVMDFIGVPETTFRRKEEAGEPLTGAGAYRVMGFLRVAATLRRLLEESGDPEEVKDFDLSGWVAGWMREELPELGGKTPAEMLRNPEGQRAVEEVLERMRGGLAA